MAAILSRPYGDNDGRALWVARPSTAMPMTTLNEGVFIYFFDNKPLQPALFQHRRLISNANTYIHIYVYISHYIFRVTGPSGHRWIPPSKASDAELCRFLWSAPEQMDEQTIETLVIWDAIALIITSPQLVITTIRGTESADKRSHYIDVIMGAMASQITSLTRKCFHLMTSSWTWQLSVCNTRPVVASLCRNLL